MHLIERYQQGNFLLHSKIVHSTFHCGIKHINQCNITLTKQWVNTITWCFLGGRRAFFQNTSIYGVKTISKRYVHVQVNSRTTQYMYKLIDFNFTCCCKLTGRNMALMQLLQPSTWVYRLGRQRLATTQKILLSFMTINHSLTLYMNYMSLTK